MKLTTESIQKAMTCPYPAKGDEFYLDPKGENAQIIDEATRRGYIRRYSTTQVEWTEEGLAKARREIGTPKEKLAEVLRIMRDEYPEDAVPRVLPILKEIEEALSVTAQRTMPVQETERLAREVCNDLSRNDSSSMVSFIAFRDEMLERLKKLQ